MKFKSKDEEILYLRNKLKEYEVITRAVYELVNTKDAQAWLDSYSYSEGVEAVETLKTLVESSQLVSDDWDYHKWCDFVKAYKPEGLEQ
jgi:hypothetical protein